MALYFRFDEKSKMAAGRHPDKFRTNISLEWVIRSTFMREQLCREGNNEREV